MRKAGSELAIHSNSYCIVGTGKLGCILRSICCGSDIQSEPTFPKLIQNKWKERTET